MNIGEWKAGDPCYAVTKRLLKTLPVIILNTDHILMILEKWLERAENICICWLFMLLLVRCYYKKRQSSLPEQMDRKSESRKLMSSGLGKLISFVQRMGDQTVGAQSLSQSRSIRPYIMPNKAITPMSKHIVIQVYYFTHPQGNFHLKPQRKRLVGQGRWTQ